MSMEQPRPSYEALEARLTAMRWELEEANDTINAIRSGQVDALIVSSENGPQLYSLKTADQTYRVFVEQMNEGALTLNSEGIILYCNSSFARMLELSSSRITGQPFEHFVAADFQEDFRRIFKLGWTEDAKAELSICFEERKFPCQLSVSVLQMDEGESLSVIVTDLTFQKETEERLKAGNKRLEETNLALEESNYDLLQFASVASHDLQEPLRKIMVFSGLLAQKLPPEEEAGAAVILGKIATSSQRMKTLIADILAYSQLAKDGVDKEPVELGTVLGEILDDYEILIRDKAARIEVGQMPVVHANRGQMRQVFQNLLSNALKFSRQNVAPLIRISSEPDAGGRSCTIKVSDNGIGFDVQYSERIFTLFQRLNTKDKFDGSGIGLSITKKIIDKHGGSISVHSAENDGTTFCIVLPVA